MSNAARSHIVLIDLASLRHMTVTLSLGSYSVHCQNMGYIIIAAFAFGGAALILYLQSLIRGYQSRLTEIPGPWYGPFTSLHLNYGFSTGDIWKAVEEYHSRYGSIVRLGPRQVWVADKDALKMILVKNDLPKVATYKEFSRDRYSPGIFGEM